jgi:hypothetical protein
LEYYHLVLDIACNNDELTIRNVSQQQVWNKHEWYDIARLIQQYQELDHNFSADIHKTLGYKLFDYLIDGDGYRNALNFAQNNEQILLLSIRTSDIQLSVLPWEILHDGEQYLALHGDVQVMRSAMAASPRRLLVEAPPLHILLTAAPDNDSMAVYCRDEEARFRQFAEHSQGVVNLTTVRNVTAPQLFNTLLTAERQKASCHIWHHIGPINDNKIVFANSELEWDEFNKLLAKFEDLRMVTLDTKYHNTIPADVVVAWSQSPVSMVSGFVRNVRDISKNGVFVKFYETLIFRGLPSAVRAVSQLISAQDIMDQFEWRSFVTVNRTPETDILTVPASRMVTSEQEYEMNSRDQVFISYSHKDEVWLEQLRTHLAPLERQNIVKVWADTDIRVGSQWKADIDKALERARVAVLLVSPNFLASDFIANDELPPILEAAKNNELRIFWIAVSASVYQSTPINHYQAAHNPDKPLDMLSAGEVNQLLAKIALKIGKELAS